MLFRLYWLPLKVLHSTGFGSMKSYGDKHILPFYMFFNFMLWTPQLLNIYWFLVSTLKLWYLLLSIPLITDPLRTITSSVLTSHLLMYPIPSSSLPIPIHSLSSLCLSPNLFSLFLVHYIFHHQSSNRANRWSRWYQRRWRWKHLPVSTFHDGNIAWHCLLSVCWVTSLTIHISQCHYL